MEQYQAAVRLVPPDPPLAESAHVLAAYGEALMGHGRYRESRHLCEEAVAIARRIGALAEEGDARRVLGVDLAFLGDLEAGVEQLDLARRIARSVGKVDEVARTFAVLSGLLEAFGRLEEAARIAAEGADEAAGRGLGRWHGPFLTATAARALFALGRWDDAEAYAAACIRTDVARAERDARLRQHGRAQLDVARGLPESAAELLTVARAAYALTLTQPWIAAPLFAATAELALRRAASRTRARRWRKGFASPSRTSTSQRRSTPSE